MSPCSRRRALQGVAALAAGPLFWKGARGLQAQDLGQFSAGPPPCNPDAKLTPAAPEGTDFRRGAPARTSLLDKTTAGTKLLLTGTVSGVSCGPIRGARIDFWQADANGAYDRTGFRLRGYQLTDAIGAYHLETIVPGPRGHEAPRLHVKVQPPGRPAFTTQLFFPNQPLNATDPQFRPELVVAVTPKSGALAGKFNIVLNL